MEATLFIDEETLETALEAARNAGAGPKLRGLATTVSGAVQGHIDATWDLLANIFRRAYQVGADVLVQLRQEAYNVVAAATEVAAQAAKVTALQAETIATALRRKIEAYVTELVNLAMLRVPSHLRVGDATLTLSKVQITQKVALNGSWKTSIDGALALTAGGELRFRANIPRPCRSPEAVRSPR